MITSKNHPFIVVPDKLEGIFHGIDRNVLYDTNVIEGLIKFRAQNILDQFQDLGIQNWYIHPVYAELMRTDSMKTKVARGDLLGSYGFNALPMQKMDFDNAGRIQRVLDNYKCYPQPTDLYLGSQLLRFVGAGKLYLLTGNIKDFPEPVYERKGYVIFQNQSSIITYSFLTINKGMIDEK